MTRQSPHSQARVSTMRQHLLTVMCRCLLCCSTQPTATATATQSRSGILSMRAWNISKPVLITAKKKGEKVICLIYGRNRFIYPLWKTKAGLNGTWTKEWSSTRISSGNNEVSWNYLPTCLCSDSPFILFILLSALLINIRKWQGTGLHKS